METQLTIKKMIIEGNKMYVPSYQRAYSWETELENSKTPKQVNVFLSDLEDYNNSHKTNSTPYYFGHFLFENKGENKVGIIDGQQRMTTIVIFVSSLFKRLKKIKEISENENILFEDLIKRGNSIYRFETVDYDNRFFKDYVIDQKDKNNKNLDTESKKRIAKAFDFFNGYLSDKDENYILKMLSSIENASCTKHNVANESEAIQMFIFQNNRGKKPSNLEIIKAQFMFNVHLYGEEETKVLIEEIKDRFENIYKSISSIEYNIDEDDVLIYTLRVHFNSLWENGAIDRINRILSEENRISFIKEFTYSLDKSFQYLTTFFGDDQREYLPIHSLITLGGIGISLPFVVKAYQFGIEKSNLCKLCSSLESLVLRHRLIGTRADITSRINSVFQNFDKNNSSIEPIIKQIEDIKNVENGWWAHWNNETLIQSINGFIHHPTAKFILWKYENHLESQGKSGYQPTRFDKIEYPELEHIAPQTETLGGAVSAGYDEYDEEFRNEYIDCLGNYLLLSKSHNCSASNSPFRDKRNSYNYLMQQKEIQEMTNENIIWNKSKINERHKKIINFVMETF